MKNYLLILLLIILVGCGTSPDFSRKQTIINKTTGKDKISTYITNKRPWNGFLQTASFNAPDTFAEVGDALIFRDNKIVVIKTEGEIK